MDGSGLEERLVEEGRSRDGNGDLKKRVWEEWKTLWRIALPSIIFRVTAFGIIVVAQSFLGHVGELHLAAYALLQTIFLRFINGLLVNYLSIHIYIYIHTIINSSSAFYK